MIIQPQNEEIPEDARIVEYNDDGTRTIYFDGDDKVILKQSEELAEVSRLIRIEAKHNRKITVDKITVVAASGHIFDGDEVSQNRMARAIVVMDDTETITWVLANNTQVQVRRFELVEALRLAWQEQTSAWLLN